MGTHDEKRLPGPRLFQLFSSTIWTPAGKNDANLAVFLVGEHHRRCVGLEEGGHVLLVRERATWRLCCVDLHPRIEDDHGAPDG